MDANRSLALLRDLGARRAQARTTLDQIRPLLRTAVRDAHTAGIPITDIARTTGLTRAAIYHILHHADPRLPRERFP